jgi:hypothetical protein
VTERLSETKPTTLAGCAEAVAAVEEDGMLGSCEWHEPVLKNVAEALRRLRA